MGDEPKKEPGDIQGILSDLDQILGGLDAETPEAAAAPKPVEPPKPAAPAAGEPELKIELAPREGTLPAAAKKPEPAKPVPRKPLASEAKPPLELGASAPPAAPAKPAAPPPAPAPAPAAPPASGDEIPAAAAKDQIRRVAYVHTFACAEARASLAAFLSQAARTISKKPLYLRSVMVAEVGPASDPNAVCEKARQAQAVAVLAVVEGWPNGKVEGLSEACARGGLLFRVVAPADVQKKSTAVDVIVDMMLLPGEA